MGTTVLLRHDLPDGSWHFDWLIQRGKEPGAPLLAFRLTEPIHEGRARSFRGTRLPDHRAAYLDYEGPISGDRGRVRRLATGTVHIEAAGPDHLLLRGRLGDADGLFQGRCTQGPKWAFTFEPTGA